MDHRREKLESIVFWLFLYLADFRLQSATRAIQANDKGAADDKAACLIQPLRTRGRKVRDERKEKDKGRKRLVSRGRRKCYAT